MSHRPRIRPFSPDQVHIRREGEYAILEAADPRDASVRFKLGARVNSMTDAEILDEWNRGAEAHEQFVSEYEFVAVEIPPGRPQIAFSNRTGNWSARGDVLRCYIDFDHKGDGPLIRIDEQALTLEEFGRMLLEHEGWGMRIAFVPDDELDVEPDIVVRDPDAQDDPNVGRA